jgi:glycosyltransferase involved in cell wall biosynthesis
MTDRPSVTFALCAFNQEKYVADAVLGALAQTYSPLEIVLSDDCSSDGTYAIMERLAQSYSGPHRIRLNRNPANLGLIAHVNKLVEISSGELIVAAAGDDVSLPHRVERLVAAYESSQPKPTLLHSSAKTIDQDGNAVGMLAPPFAQVTPTLASIAEAEAVYIGATGCWHRDLFRAFGPIQQPDAYEDLVLGFRAALNGGMAYVRDPLVEYRVDVGISTNPNRSTMDLARLVTGRMKLLKAMGGVYRQRLSDLLRHGDAEKVQALVVVLEKQVTLQERRLLFYRNVLALIAQVVKPRPALTLKALGIEGKYLLWAILGRWQVVIASRLRRSP